MLYLSLILIASGLFFIIYTLLIKSKKETGTTYQGRSFGTDNTVRNAMQKSRESKIAEKLNKSGSEDEQKMRSGRINVERDSASRAEISRDDSFGDAGKGTDNEVYGIEDKFEDEGMSENTPVVMYEDASNIIDYNNNDSIIDSTLKEYKKIKRVGAGNLEFPHDGINFRVGKKLYRFDFRRIADIKSGSNFIVLMMKGSSILKLFLFKNDSLLSERLKKVYNKYSANVL
jgi:hypothetical protein